MRKNLKITSVSQEKFDKFKAKFDRLKVSFDIAHEHRADLMERITIMQTVIDDQDREILDLKQKLDLLVTKNAALKRQLEVATARTNEP